MSLNLRTHHLKHAGSVSACKERWCIGQHRWVDSTPQGGGAQGEDVALQQVVRGVTWTRHLHEAPVPRSGALGVTGRECDLYLAEGAGSSFPQCCFLVHDLLKVPFCLLEIPSARPQLHPRRVPLRGHRRIEDPTRRLG